MGGNRWVDRKHIEVGPCENVLVLSKHLLDVLSLPGFQEGINIGETIILLPDLDGFQGICHRGIFIRQVL